MGEERSLAKIIEGRYLWMMLCISLVYIMILVLNLNYPLFFDDWHYSFVFGSDQRVSSISDVFHSQYNHYFQWGGRSVVHAICQFLLMLDFFWLCIVNALAYVILIYVIYSIANKGNKTNPIVFFLCHVLVWFLQLAFCQTVLWKTGSANYLWGMMIVLLFIYPYYRYFRDRKSKDNIAKIFLFLVGGIIAGWTNENIGIALVFYIFCSIVLYKREKIEVPGWAIFGLVGAVIGCLAMLLAPGNFIRLESVKEMLAVQGKTMPEQYIINLKEIFRYSLQSIFPLFFAYLLGLFIYKRQGKMDRSILWSSMLFALTAFVALFALLVSSTSEKRALFGVIVLFIIPTVMIYANLDFQRQYLKTLNIVILSMLLLYYVIDYTWKYQTLKIVSTAWSEREPLIQEYKNKGIDTITFTNRYQIHTKYGLQDLDERPTEPVNVVCAKYYGFRYMRAVENSNKQTK